MSMQMEMSAPLHQFNPGYPPSDSSRNRQARMTLLRVYLRKVLETTSTCLIGATGQPQSGIMMLDCDDDVIQAHKK